jgi:hypothetical protein
MAKDKGDHRGAVISFLAPPQMIERMDDAAAAEGISRSDVARRAVLRDLQRQPSPEAA